jgi:hypothetical protein
MLPTNASYRCKKNMVLGGQRLTAGSLLPSDSPVRQNPRRLEILYRTRMIEPAETTSVAVKAAPTRNYLDSLTIDEVKQLLENRDMNTRGKEEALRERLKGVL